MSILEFQIAKEGTVHVPLPQLNITSKKKKRKRNKNRHSVTMLLLHQKHIMRLRRHKIHCRPRLGLRPQWGAH